MLWISIILIVCALVLLARFFFRKPGMSPSARKNIRSQWNHAVSHQDPHRRLLEADAVLGHLLEALGYTGSLADRLRSAEKIIPHLQDVWTAHKLRNRIAHEPGVRLTDAEVARALSAFERVIRKFCP